ncbi:MAG: sulfatase [Candidatus Sumerlaeia bacterium]
MTAKKKPNILVLVTDQQRADTIGALGNPIIKTPALDSLVESGVAFTRAYTPAPICSPARVSMATGIPPHEHRFTDHDWFHWEPEEGPPSPAPHDSAFMEKAHDDGYQTIMVGKLHHSGRPWLLDGVEEYAGGKEPISKKTKVLQTYSEYCDAKGYPAWLPPNAGVGSEYYMIPQATPYPEEESRPHWMADQCIDFLNRRDKDRPFLMHCHFIGPHPPISNPMPWALLYRANEMEAPHRPENYKDYQSRTNRYQLRYKGRDTSQEDDTGYRAIRAAYYASISLIDYNIGRILDALGDERENTLILFTTDHGDLMGDYGCVGKRCMLEGAIRIPMLLALPGRVPAGKRCDTAVSLMDMYPTIMDALGLDESRSDEGRSMIAIANEAQDEKNRRIVFSQFSSGWCGQYGATDGKWKYAYSAPDDKEWLFRLSDSEEEGPNLIDDPAPEAQAAKERLKTALMRRHDPSVDPFSNAVENGDWKKHEAPPETYLENPTYGMLFQERGPEELQAAINALGAGYAKNVLNREYKNNNLHRDHAVCEGVMPFAEK